MRTFKDFMEAKARLDMGATPSDILTKYGPTPQQPSPEEKEAGQNYLKSMEIQAQRAAAAKQQAARLQLLKQNPPAV